MARFLIHVTCGVENPSKAALALLVARTAIEEGHETSVFLAGDAVQLLRPAVIENLAGLGTGSLKVHIDAIMLGGGRFFVAGLSAKSRGIEESDVAAKGAGFVLPNILVKLAAESDKILCY
jgi:predicted peroxiredoxin